MQKTEKLGLNLFEGTDPVLAESFNENTKKLAEEVSRRAIVVTGTYTGDDSVTKTFTFDKKPALVLLSSGGTTLLCFHGCETGIGLVDGYANNVTDNVTLTWDDENNTLTCSNSKNYYNHKNTVYHCVAFLTDQ